MLTPIEQTWVARLLAAARSGEQLDLAPGVPDARLDPKRAAAWPVQQHLPARALRAALLQPELQADPLGLRIRGAYLSEPLDLDHAAVPCALALTHSGLRYPASFRATTLVTLDLRHSHLVGLILDNSVVGKSDLNLDHVEVNGAIRAGGAHIGGHVTLAGAVLSNPGGYALDLDRAQVDGSVFLTDRFSATGQVRLHGAHITGRLNLPGATLTNPAGYALNLDDAQVDGGVYLTKGFSANGQVRLHGSHIGGRLRISQATLTNPAGDALNIDDAHVDGGAYLTPDVRAEGRVRAIGARVRGQLDLSGAELSNPGGHPLNLARLDVDALNITNLSVGAGGVQLSNARIGVLTVDETVPAGRTLPQPLVAVGWTVQDVEGVLRDNRRAATTWLCSAPPALRAATQPWYELASVYDRNGQPADARRLRHRAAWRTTRNSPPSSKLVRILYGAVVGHGYYPLLAALWLTAALIASASLTATHPADFSPTMPAAAAPAKSATVSSVAGPQAPPPPPSVTGATPCHAQVAPSYPCLNPTLYAIDSSLPSAIGGTASAWRPTNTTWLPLTLTLLRTLVWLTTALLLAGLTGLLRKI